MVNDGIRKSYFKDEAPRRSVIVPNNRYFDQAKSLDELTD